MKLTLIRHGQSVANLGNWDQLDHIDTPLTDLGRAQCVALRDWLKQSPPQVDALYTSTLARNLETSAYIEDALGIEAISDDRIREVGHNFADGRPMAPAELPKSYISNHPGQNPYRSLTDEPVDAESWMATRVRFAGFVNDLVDRHTSETVYVVAHGGIMAMMIENILNVPPVRHGIVHTDNTALSAFEWEPSGDGRMQWVLRYHNRIDHLIQSGVGY
jgi:broad specificity phosphatase PhoE